MSDPTIAAAPPPEPHLWERRWFRDLLLLATLAAVMLGLLVAQAVIWPVLIALGMAYAFNPLIRMAKRRLRMPRLLTTLTLVLVFVMASTALIAFVMPQMLDQGFMLARKIGRYGQWVATNVEWDWRGMLGLVTGAQTTDSIEKPPAADSPPPVDAIDADHTPATTAPPEAASTARSDGETAGSAIPAVDWAQIIRPVLSWLGVGIGVIGTAVGLATYLGIALIVTVFCFVFFGWHFDTIVGWFRELIPARHRDRTLHIVSRMDRSVSAFIRGRLIQSLAMAFILCIGWRLAGVPYWMLLGVMGGVLNLVPFAAVFSWLAALTLTSLDQLTGGAAGFTWGLLLWPTLVYAVAQFADGWIIEPLVQGKATDLDPLTVLLAVLIGGTLAGPLGLILAIPVTACLKILAEELLMPRLRAAARPSPSPRPPASPPTGPGRGER